MARGYWTIIAAAAWLAAANPAFATTVTVNVTDADGHPVENAVVTLMGTSATAASAHLPNEKTIDQRNETFIPLVTIIPKGGRIVFSNNDKVTHQVYSFSAIKQFETTLGRGQSSEAFVFDKAGVAAIGCNIHDKMIAYAFVADSPWTALTGADGHAVIADVPPGHYQTQVWHPQLPPGHDMPATPADIAGDAQTLRLQVKLTGPPPGQMMMHSHAGNY